MNPTHPHLSVLTALPPPLCVLHPTPLPPKRERKKSSICGHHRLNGGLLNLWWSAPWRKLSNYPSTPPPEPPDLERCILASLSHYFRVMFNNDLSKMLLLGGVGVEVDTEAFCAPLCHLWLCNYQYNGKRSFLNSQWNHGSWNYTWPPVSAWAMDLSMVSGGTDNGHQCGPLPLHGPRKPS